MKNKGEKDHIYSYVKDLDSLAQNFHDRARATWTEIVRLKIAMSTAIVGVMVVISTQKIEPQLSLYELIFVLLSLSLASFSLFSFFTVLYVDIKRYYYLADSIQKKCPDNQFYRNKKPLDLARNFFDYLGTVFFLLSIISASIYIFLRVISNYAMK